MPHPVFDVETTVGEDRAATAPSTGENGPGCVEGVLLVVCWGGGEGGEALDESHSQINCECFSYSYRS